MREITTHKVNECNDQLELLAEDKLGPGGAPHYYELRFPDRVSPECKACVGIFFQNGPIKEVGTNGLTHEALLAILADRLEHFQAGPYACDENAAALKHIKDAQAILHMRTRARLARGVEGTHKV